MSALDNPHFDGSHIHLRWHGVVDARPRGHGTLNEVLRNMGYSQPQRIILVNGPLNGRRLTVSDDRDEWRFPYDPGPVSVLRWGPSAHAHLDGVGENMQLRYRFEDREGDVTDSGELIYRFQGTA